MPSRSAALLFAFACLRLYRDWWDAPGSAAPVPLWLLLPIYLIFVGLFAGGLDELGWRGYAARRFNRAMALAAADPEVIYQAFGTCRTGSCRLNRAAVSFPIFVVRAVALSFILSGSTAPAAVCSGYSRAHALRYAITGREQALMAVRRWAWHRSIPLDRDQVAVAASYC
jgi:hypothetical protein